MGLMKKKTDRMQAVVVCERLRVIDRALVDLVARADGLTLATQDDLAGMQRRIRAMRDEILLEHEINLAANVS